MATAEHHTPNITDDWLAWRQDMDVWRAGIDEKLRSIEKNGATKEDLANLRLWVVLTVIAVQGAFFGLSRLLP